MMFTTTTQKSPLTAAPKTTMPPLWTPEETAAALGVTVGTLQVWRTTKRYRLSYVKIGRNVMYRAEDVQAFIESRIVEA